VFELALGWTCPYHGVNVDDLVFSLVSTSYKLELFRRGMFASVPTERVAHTHGRALMFHTSHVTMRGGTQDSGSGGRTSVIGQTTSTRNTVHGHVGVLLGGHFPAWA